AQFAPPKPLPKPPYWSGSGNFAVLDENGDGLPDLQYLEFRFATTYRTITPGNLGAPQQTTLPMYVNGSLQLRWDEDTLPDTVYYGYTQDGFPTQSSLMAILTGNGQARDQIEIAPPRSGAVPTAAGDFDGEGVQDLLFAARVIAE